MRPGCLADTALAFSRDSSAAIWPGSSKPARASISRSSTSAGSISIGTPALSSTARRDALLDASIKGSAASHNGIFTNFRLLRRQAAALGEQRHDLGRGLFDRAARDVDDRPVVLGAELSCRRDLAGHSLLVDILIGIVLGVQPEQTVLPDLHDP